MTSQETLESIARELESKFYDRYEMGYVNGVRAAVLSVRLGEPIARRREDALLAHKARGQRDVYDTGFLDGLAKAARIMGEEI